MKPNMIVSIVIGILVVGGLIWWFTRSTTPSDTTNQTVNVTTNTTTSNVNEDRSFNTGNTNTNTTANTNTAPTPLTITISSEGMSPNSPTIARGTTVIFRNADSIEHQIASDPHPDHTDLPGFDLEIAPGASKQFTFSRVGGWGYHDHEQDLNTKYQGTITVE